jgi:hypothetical protein
MTGYNLYHKRPSMIKLIAAKIWVQLTFEWIVDQLQKQKKRVQAIVQ